MFVNDGGTAAPVDENKFIQLSTTSPLSRFTTLALHSMYRWYADPDNQPAEGVEFDPYEITRAWRELTGQTLVAEYGLPGQRNTNADDATVQSVLARLETETAVIRLGNNGYLVLEPKAQARFRS